MGNHFAMDALYLAGSSLFDMLFLSIDEYRITLAAEEIIVKIPMCIYTVLFYESAPTSGQCRHYRV